MTSTPTASTVAAVAALRCPAVTTPELWTTNQAAEHCGVAPSTFRAYRTKPSLGVPAPVGSQPGRGGQDLYDADAIRTWHANRPGRGARTDLQQESAPDS